METKNPWKIAVLGSAQKEMSPSEKSKVISIGKEVALRGGIVLTGACPGFPHVAASGAQSAGGIAIGISPAMNRKEHQLVYEYPLDSDIIMFTGMGLKGRNIILVRSADACIFVGGGMGTLNEFTIAYDELNENCAIGILLNSGGLSNEYLRLAELSGKRSSATLIADHTPEGLVQAVFDFLASRAYS